MERHIKVSTQGRLTIPKQMRDLMRITDGQPIVIRSDFGRGEIVIVVQPKITDFR